jgi:photosystem II reaction center protein PsbM
MEVNILGLIAVLLFVLIPTSFLLILYVKLLVQRVQKVNNFSVWRKLITLDSILSLSQGKS